MVEDHTPGDDEQTLDSRPLPGAHASPLDAVERARWQAAQAHADDAAGAVLAGDGSGLEAALGALRAQNLDIRRLVDAIHLPDDAGEWAESLERILRRIPDGWGRSLGCRAGWYPLLARLDARLNDIDPAYEVHQCRQKYATLSYYAEASPCPCCVEWDASHPRPDLDDEAAWKRWAESNEEHLRSPGHAAAEAARRRRQQRMNAAISLAEAESATTCEFTGGPGVRMVRNGWVRVIAPGIPEAEGYRPA